MKEGTLEKPLQQETFRWGIVLGKALEEFEDGRNTGAFGKHLFHHLNDGAIGQTKDHTLVNNPCLQGVSKDAPLKVFNATWIIILVTLMAIPLSPHVLRDRLATPMLREMEVNDRVFHHVFRYVEGFTFVLRAHSAWCNTYDLPCAFWEYALICLVSFLSSTFLRLVMVWFGGGA